MKLKECLTTAPVLTLPTGLGGYPVFCDASRVVLGCVLMYTDHKSLKYIFDQRVLNLGRVVADTLSKKSMGSLVHILMV